MPTIALARRAAVGALLAVAAPAVSTAGAQTLTNQYFLNGTLADALGGPALQSLGGSLLADRYTFGANQGLRAGFTPGAAYSIVLRFAFDNVLGYRKIVDFKDRTSDAGAYVFGREANFYPVQTGSGMPFVAGAPATFVLTRTAAGFVTGYVGGTARFQFDDATDQNAVFSAAPRFFVDDAVTSGNEASSGYANYVAFYDGALSADQVSALQIPSAPTSTVPEPSTWAMLATGLLGVGVAARRRARPASRG